MKTLRRWLLLFCPALFLFTPFFTLLPVAPACALSANSLGDYDNIAVMELSGDCSAVTESGEFNSLPRQVVSQEFYRQHGDFYQF
jgi:hypothetical protein